ncbi:MAG TPA: hypothetical protein VFV08_06930 [Puia sp.]|nr:hypothetical protein [Puia sp.]
MKRVGKIFLFFLFILFTWICIDLFFPFKTNLKNFNYVEVARLDATMWRSYYEKRKFSLFLESAELMRKQFHVPLWRSQLMAYHAAKAAFIFKDGHNRADYIKALPHLEKYYGEINRISDSPFNVNKAAALELEWWIIRRDRIAHPPSEWEVCLSNNAETVYHLPPEKFFQFAHLRVAAMLFRDSLDKNITPSDWQHIQGMLTHAWQDFSDSLRQ